MNKKKLTSIILCLAMLLSILPFTNNTASAYSYTRKLQPGGTTSITLIPSDHTIDVSLTDGKSGSKIKSYPSSWVTVENYSSTVYRVKVKPNPGAQREGNVVFEKNNKQYTLKITQSKNYINNVPSKQTVTAATGSFNFSVSVGTGTPTASDNRDWISVSKSGNKFTISYQANTGAARAGTVTVNCGNVKVTCTVVQSASPRTSISGLQTSTNGSIYKDEWTNYRAAELTNFYNALLLSASGRSRTILTRAKELATCSWTCQKTFTGYGGWVFNKDQKYYGTPYQQYGNYIGHGYTVSDLIDNANNKDSYFYTRGGSKGPGYGTDCSGFASYCGGTPWVKADEFSSQTSYFSKITDSSKFAENIEAGDVLHRSGHVLIVAAVFREKDGAKAKGIVLLESRNRTTASGRNMYVFYDNDEALKKLFGGVSLGSCHTYIKNVVWAGTDNEANRTLKHIGTVAEFVSSFETHTLLHRK